MNQLQVWKQPQYSVVSCSHCTGSKQDKSTFDKFSTLLIVNGFILSSSYPVNSLKNLKPMRLNSPAHNGNYEGCIKWPFSTVMSFTCHEWSNDTVGVCVCFWNPHNRADVTDKSNMMTADITSLLIQHSTIYSHRHRNIGYNETLLCFKIIHLWSLKKFQ